VRMAIVRRMGLRKTFLTPEDMEIWDDELGRDKLGRTELGGSELGENEPGENELGEYDLEGSYDDENDLDG
jgi:hypothetical protein